jgi:microcystin-dependent protein
MQGNPGIANQNSPANNSFSRAFGGGSLYKGTPFAPVAMGAQVIAPAGGDTPHNNMMPYLTLNFCIALQGVFPPRG